MSDSFLDLALDQVEDMQPADPGEYQITCTKARLGNSKTNGDPYIMLTLITSDDDSVPSFTDVNMLPGEESDSRQKKERLAGIKKLVTAWGIDPADFSNVEQFIGLTTWAVLRQEESAEYGVQNSVQQYIGPR